MQRIGVLGSAGVGKTLAEGFKKHGYAVRIGSRSPGKLAEFSKQSGIEAGTFEDVAAWGEILVLAVKGMAAEPLVAQLGTRLDGKVIIDTTNPIAEAPPTDGVLSYFTGPNESLLERLQKSRPAARFVKSWSSVGAARMVDPAFGDGTPTMFLCGNDDAARKSVAAILDQFGWEAADMGTAVAARAIEPLAMLWCIPGFRENVWNHAFKVLRK
jgi:8-hydroxy-5-deazaflavin:NADPH oxidoreductase